MVIIDTFIESKNLNNGDESSRNELRCYDNDLSYIVIHSSDEVGYDYYEEYLEKNDKMIHPQSIEFFEVINKDVSDYYNIHMNLIYKVYSGNMNIVGNDMTLTDLLNIRRGNGYWFSGEGIA